MATYRRTLKRTYRFKITRQRPDKEEGNEVGKRRTETWCWLWWFGGYGMLIVFSLLDVGQGACLHSYNNSRTWDFRIVWIWVAKCCHGMSSHETREYNRLYRLFHFMRISVCGAVTTRLTNRGTSYVFIATTATTSATTTQPHTFHLLSSLCFHRNWKG